MDKITFEQNFTFEDVKDIIAAATGEPVNDAELVAYVNAVVEEREAAAFAPGAPTKRRGRKPGSKNKPKLETQPDGSVAGVVYAGDDDNAVGQNEE